MEENNSKEENSGEPQVASFGHVPTEVVDGTTECIANNVAVGSDKQLSLEAVMVEVTSVKHLVLQMMKRMDELEKGLTTEVHMLLRSFATIQCSIEVLESIANYKGKESITSSENEGCKPPHVPSEEERFAKELAEIGLAKETDKTGNVDDSFGKYIHKGFFRGGLADGTPKHEYFNGGSSSIFGGLDNMDDHMVDDNVSNTNTSTKVGRAFVPNHWLEEDTPPKGRISENKSLHITRSDFNRHFVKSAPPLVPESAVNKRLKFHTPSPDQTQSRTSKSNKVHQSAKNVKVKFEVGTPKSGKKASGVKRKGKETCLEENHDSNYVGREEQQMSPSCRNAQVCTYIFHKTAETNLVNETLVLIMGLTARRSELQCLVPPEGITQLIIALEAARITSKHTIWKSVWTFPPSFAFDFEDGLTLQSIRAKYCKEWMPPFTNLQYIYIPLRGAKGHWFLMLVHVPSGTIYHLDSDCPNSVTEHQRQFKMQKMGLLLNHLVTDDEYSVAFRNKRTDFHKFVIARHGGIHNACNSNNSGVWVLQWLNMEHYFSPGTFCNTLNERDVRMKIAAELTIGDQNALRLEVIKKAAAYSKTIVANRIDLDPE